MKGEWKLRFTVDATEVYNCNGRPVPLCGMENGEEMQTHSDIPIKILEKPLQFTYTNLPVGRQVTPIGTKAAILISEHSPQSGAGCEIVAIIFSLELHKYIYALIGSITILYNNEQK